MNKIEFLHRIALNEPNVSISVVCPSLEGLKALWNDTLSIFVLGAKRKNKVEYIWEYGNGSMVLFQHFDTVESCFGMLRDYLYTYDNINSDIYDKLVQRTRIMVFLEMIDR